jgi:hypothetical protein
VTRIVPFSEFERDAANGTLLDGALEGIAERLGALDVAADQQADERR